MWCGSVISCKYDTSDISFLVFFCPPLHTKVGLLQHMGHGTTIVGFSPFGVSLSKEVLWHWVTISYGCVHFNRCRADATELSYVHVDFSFFGCFFFSCAPLGQMNTQPQKYDCWQLLWGFILQLRNKWNKLIAAKNVFFFFFTISSIKHWNV